jgi:hypothetical protein
MKSPIRWPAGLLLLATPLAAYAQGAPHILYSLIGGAAGGFIGALGGCWMCKKMGQKKDDGPKQY